MPGILIDIMAPNKHRNVLVTVTPANLFSVRDKVIEAFKAANAKCFDVNHVELKRIEGTVVDKIKDKLLTFDFAKGNLHLKYGYAQHQGDVYITMI